MALTDSLRILITANGAQAEREFAQVGAASRRSLGQAETATARYSRSLTSAGVAMATFGGLMLVGLAKAAQAAEEERAALLRLENVISTQPALAGASTDAFLEQAAALQDTTRFADDATVAAQGMLGAFGLTQDQILEIIPLVQDYAAITGTDLATAAKQVGRSVSGTNGTLKRAGVTFDEAAYSADHFAATMEALQRRAGGFAAQEAQTLSGQLDILKNNFADVAEGVGVGVVEAFSSMMGATDEVLGGLEKLSPGAEAAIGKFLTFGAVALTAVGVLSFMGGQVLRVVGLLSQLPKAIAATRTAMVGLSAAMATNPLGMLALAVGTTIGVLASFSGEQGKAKDATDGTTDAIMGQTNALAGLRAALDQSESSREKASGDEFTAAMAAAGLTIEDLKNALSGSDADMEEFAKALSKTGEVAGYTATDWDHLQYVISGGFIGDPTPLSGLDRIKGRMTELQAGMDGAATATERQNAVFGGTAAAAGDAAAAIDELTQEINDYLASVFDVPAAQRDLRSSFDDLFQLFLSGTGTADDYSAALEDIVKNAGDVVSAQIEQDASQEEINYTLEVTRKRLKEARDAGIISQATFNRYNGVLRGMEPIVRTRTETPGLTTALTRARDLDAEYGDLNGRTVRSIVQADVLRAEFDRLMRDLEASEERRFRMQVSVDRQPGAAVGRMFPLGGTTLVGERGPELVTIPAGGRVFNNAESSMRLKAAGREGGGATTIVVPVMLDGEKIAEVVANTDRRYNAARGEN